MTEFDSYRAEVEESFPGLVGARWKITSPPDRSYNCLAWALGLTHGWYAPAPLVGFEWPPDVSWSGDDIEAITRLFESRGFVQSEDDEATADLAIFQNAGAEWHVARRLDSTTWTSKLGEHVDISHALDALEGAVYGRVVRLMRRTEATR